MCMCVCVYIDPYSGNINCNKPACTRMYMQL